MITTAARGTSVQNVDKVLKEMRLYLIANGSTVAAKDVNADTGNVYLLLEWACGLCTYSTVTMMREHIETWFRM